MNSKTEALFNSQALRQLDCRLLISSVLQQNVTGLTQLHFIWILLRLQIADNNNFYTNANEFTHENNRKG